MAIKSLAQFVKHSIPWEFQLVFLLIVFNTKFSVAITNYRKFSPLSNIHVLSPNFQNLEVWEQRTVADCSIPDLRKSKCDRQTFLEADSWKHLAQFSSLIYKEMVFGSSLGESGGLFQTPGGISGLCPLYCRCSMMPLIPLIPDISAFSSAALLIFVSPYMTSTREKNLLFCLMHLDIPKNSGLSPYVKIHNWYILISVPDDFAVLTGRKCSCCSEPSIAPKFLWLLFSGYHSTPSQYCHRKQKKFLAHKAV